MKTLYVSDDGLFKNENEDEVVKYEEERAAEKLKKEKLKAEKAERKTEIESMYDTLCEKIKAYNKDYKEAFEFKTKNYQTISDFLDLFRLW